MKTLPRNSSKMYNYAAWIILLSNVGFVGFSAGIQWLSISKVFSLGSQQPSHYNYVSLCNKASILTQEQQQVCRHYYSMMNSVADGASLAVEECQRQFSSERWNCSTQYPMRNYGRTRRRRRSVFGPELISGTKEAAFVYAVSSAAVAYSVTRDCSKGLIEDCGCDKSWPQHAHISSHFKWGGCSDNIAWGKEMSRKFIDIQEHPKLFYKRKTKKSRKRLRKRWKNEVTVNLNNNKIGRESVVSSMRNQCKCHGVSSSCDQITCWRSLPDFSEVGKQLKESYNTAIQVHVVRKHDRPFLRSKGKPPQLRRDLGLVYLRRSPISCSTVGRQCDPDPVAGNSCEKICCGRGYFSRTKHVPTQCNCKFDWCCSVVCQTCNETVREHRCR